MTNYTELKRLAEVCVAAGEYLPGEAWEDDRRYGPDEEAFLAFAPVATPAAVLALIAENERLAASVKLNLCDYPAIHQGDVDLLVAFVTGASQIELAKVHGCTPPNISRKIRRVKERLGWRDGMPAAEIRARAEQLRGLASQGAVVTADLMAERDHLKADNVAALREATDLAMAIWRRCYAKDSPNFQPFEKASSVIGQIDNMAAGLMSDLERLKAENEALRKALEAAEDAMWKAESNMDSEAANARDTLAAVGKGEQS